jgi:quinolinate synthase
MTVDAAVIVQAGVHFMAETAKLLNPDKRVLIPDLLAGCSLPPRSRPTTCVRYADAIPAGSIIASASTMRC